MSISFVAKANTFFANNFYYLLGKGYLNNFCQKWETETDLFLNIKIVFKCKNDVAFCSFVSLLQSQI